MRNVRILTVVSVLLLFPLSMTALGESSPNPLSQEQLEAIAIQPARNWGATGSNVVPEMLPLFKEESIKFNGTTKKYRLHVPEKLEPDKKYPMILWLHGAGESGNDNKLQLVHLHHIITSLTGEKKRDFFLLVPQYGSNEFWAQDGGGSYMSVANVPDNIKEDKKKLEVFKKDLVKQARDAAPPNAVVTLKEEKITSKQPKPIKRMRVEKVGGFMGFGSKEVHVEEIIGFDEDDAEEVEMLLIKIGVETEATGGPLEFAFAMVDHVAENYPVDRNRITVSGLSTGGDGTWRALERRPELFAAAVPLVSWNALRDRDIEQSPILKKIPIWAIYSSDDNSIDWAREDFERVEKAGCNVKKTEFGICGHSAWTPAMLQADIFAWLLSRGKKDGEYIQIFDPGVDPDQMKGIVDVATRNTSQPALAPAVQDVPSLPPLRAVDMQIVSAAPLPPQQVPPEVLAELRHVVDAAEQRRAAELTQYQAASGRREMSPPATPNFSAEKENVCYVLAEKYFHLADGFITISRENRQARGPQAELAKSDAETAMETFERFVVTFKKLSPEAQLDLLPQLIGRARSLEGLRMLEGLLDDIPVHLADYPASMVDQRVIPPPTAPAAVYIYSNDEEVAEEVRTISAERIIEECNRPWAMTSESLYGMFAADWDKEAEAIPDFVVNSSSDDLAKKLATSIGNDPEAADFVAACKSILALQNKPMSSPWFETSGGRMQSDIQYSLSAKGQMFVRFLRAVKDSSGTDKAKELSKVAEKTMEKIEMVLAK